MAGPGHDPSNICGGRVSVPAQALHTVARRSNTVFDTMTESSNKAVTYVNFASSLSFRITSESKHLHDGPDKVQYASLLGLIQHYVVQSKTTCCFPGSQALQTEMVKLMSVKLTVPEGILTGPVG